jgi:hypothetical protein
MRTIPDPGFAGDPGSADPALRAALAAHAGDGRTAPVLVALAGARLLVPVVAVLDEAGTSEQGLAVDKSSDMAAVLLTGRDGRRALLAFTGTDSLAAWDPTARPVPVTVQQAAVAACQESAAAIVVDVAGPARFVLEGDDLLRVAAGDVLVPVAEGHAWRAAQ